MARRRPAKYNEVIEGLGDRIEVTRTIELDFKDPCAPSITPLALTLWMPWISTSGMLISSGYQAPPTHISI